MSSRVELEPIFVSVQDAARALSVSPWAVYQLLDSQAVESRYHGRRRLVDVKSLRAYAANLPKYPTTDAAS